MPNDPVTAALQGAKNQLAKASQFTQSVEGNPTSAFAPPKMMPHISGIKAAPTHEYSEAPYALAHDLQAKKDNVDQYKKAVPE
jgi:hypothetical protein